MPHHFDLAESSERYRQVRRTIEFQTQSIRPALTSPIIIPVVVHVLHSIDEENISDEQVYSQLEVLNDDFRMQNADLDLIPEPFAQYAADSMIGFGLANRDPSGQPTTGIIRTRVPANYLYDKALSPRERIRKLDQAIKQSGTGSRGWPSGSYLNLWVCRIRGDLLGYAQFPEEESRTDGVVINCNAFGTIGTAQAPYDLGRTAVHEVGHWLNLLHIWGDDGGGCDKSDNVHDTPNQANSSSEMPEFPRISCGNHPHGDMFMNYMDYTDDAGMFMFTLGQVGRMQAALLGPRASLGLSKGIVSDGAERMVEFSLRKAILLPDEQKVFDGVDWR